MPFLRAGSPIVGARRHYMPRGMGQGVPDVFSTAPGSAIFNLNQNLAKVTAAQLGVPFDPTSFAQSWQSGCNPYGPYSCTGGICCGIKPSVASTLPAFTGNFASPAPVAPVTPTPPPAAALAQSAAKTPVVGQSNAPTPAVVASPSLAVQGSGVASTYLVPTMPDTSGDWISGIPNWLVIGGGLVGVYLVFGGKR